MTPSIPHLNIDAEPIEPWVIRDGHPQAGAEFGVANLLEGGDGGLTAGVWTTPARDGVVHLSSAIEVQLLLDGDVRVAGDGAGALDLRPGDAFVLRVGDVSRWTFRTPSRFWHVMAGSEDVIRDLEAGMLLTPPDADAP